MSTNIRNQIVYLRTACGRVSQNRQNDQNLQYFLHKIAVHLYII